jgi:DNA-binding transcriptional MerR regulator
VRTGHTLWKVGTLSIGQLAHEAGVNVETIRYYERRGLLREPPRTHAGYRQYSGADLWRLQLIARAKHMGFTLAEIATLVGEDGDGSVHGIVAMARAKVRALDEDQQRLADSRARLDRLIDVCQDPDDEDCVALRVTS